MLRLTKVEFNVPRCVKHDMKHRYGEFFERANFPYLWADGVMKNKLA